MRKKESYIQIVRALSRIFEGCCYCDVANDRYQLYLNGSLVMNGKSDSYSQTFLYKFGQYIASENREAVNEQLSIAHLSQVLDRSRMTYFLTVRPEADQNTTDQITALYLDGDEDGGLSHFAVVFGLNGASEDKQRQELAGYYEELRHTMFNENLYREAVLDTGIAAYHINLTKDLIEDEFSQHYQDRKIPVLPTVGIHAPCSYNEYCDKWQVRVSDNTLEEYHRSASCEKLLAAYRAGQQVVTVHYQTLDTLDHAVYVQKRIIMDENSDNGDIVGVCVLSLFDHGSIEAIDTVTGLPNQTKYNKQIQLSCRANKPISVIKIGIDSFVNINVAYGFAYGNKVMRCFAAELKKLLGTRGEVYRLEGAKFGLLSNSMDKQQMKQLFGEVQQLATDKVIIDGHPVPLRISGGAVHANRYDLESVKCGATYALRHSKREHHGELVFFDNEIDRDDQDNLKLLSTIHYSVSEDCRGFYLCYQPLVDVKTREIVGMEALLRWEQEPYGTVPPGKFIPWLEEDPVFYDLGNWILRRAMLDAMEMKKRRPNLFLNVNIAAVQMEHHGFRQSVIDILKETGFPPTHLCMELTERCRHLDYDFLREEILFFQSLGIQVAMDDFGTGIASLNLLTELPINEMKIDMSFTRRLLEHSTNRAIVRAMVQCANEIQIKTCIEGVETTQLQDYLAQLSPTYYQGYLYSKPVRAQQFMQLLV